MGRRSKGACWHNLCSTGTMAAVGMVAQELSSERGSDFLRGKGRGEVNINLDEVKRRKKWRKVSLASVTLRGETWAVLGPPCSREKIRPKGLAGLNRAADEVVGPGDVRRWDICAAWHPSDPSEATEAPMGHSCSVGIGGRLTSGLARYAHDRFLFIQIFSNGFELEPVKRWPSIDRKFSNKRCNCWKLMKKTFPIGTFQTLEWNLN
jgi:hypothetical protein